MTDKEKDKQTDKQTDIKHTIKQTDNQTDKPCIFKNLESYRFQFVKKNTENVFTIEICYFGIKINYFQYPIEMLLVYLLRLRVLPNTDLKG